MDVTSYMARHAASLGDPPDAFDEFAPVRVAVLAPERTLVEKLMCLHSAALRAEKGDAAELLRGVRHYYDVRQLLGDPGVAEGVTAFPGGASGIAADVHEHSRASGFASDRRPEGGFAKSPAFDLGAPWMAPVREAYAAALPQLVWRDCPSFEECVQTVTARAAGL
jgi:hypothetical protein